MIPVHKLLSEILQRVDAKTPTSICRYGDGESIMLNLENDKEMAKWVAKRQLGYVPTDKELQEIKQNLINAYRAADIIGIPVSNRFMEDEKNYWARSNAILFEVLGFTAPNDRVFTNIDFHSYFLEHNHFDTLLKGRDTVCYISCRTLDEKLAQTFNIKNVYSFQIAPEMKFETTYLGPQHYPVQFNQIKKWMDSIPVEGNICLVGAGVVGKIYNNWFRDRGGISIDIGSCFDAFVGKKTRGEGRGADAVDETYKL